MNYIHTSHWLLAGKTLVWFTGRMKGWASPASFTWAQWNPAPRNKWLRKIESVTVLFILYLLRWVKSLALMILREVGSRVWAGWSGEPIVPFSYQTLLSSMTKLFWSNVLSVYICASWGGVSILSMLVREQVGKVFVRSMRRESWRVGCCCLLYPHCSWAWSLPLRQSLGPSSPEYSTWVFLSPALVREDKSSAFELVSW